MSSSAPTRKSRGRQKVSMVKMQNHSTLQVTFSKRRAGLFKKASELCTLCGAEAAILVFSPANKAYCFGHPNLKTVVDRLSAGMDPAPANPRSHLIIEVHRNSTIREHTIELTRVESLLRAEEIELLRKAGHVQRWLPPSLDHLDFSQLRALEESVMGFKKNFDAKVQEPKFRVSQHENPSGFPNNNVQTFDFPTLSLGLGDSSHFFNAAVGPSRLHEQTSLKSSIDRVQDYLMKDNNSGGGGAMFNVAGGGVGVSFMTPNYDHETSGSAGVGFGLGYSGQGLFQMF